MWTPQTSHETPPGFAKLSCFWTIQHSFCMFCIKLTDLKPFFKGESFFLPCQKTHWPGRWAPGLGLTTVTVVDRKHLWNARGILVFRFSYLFSLEENHMLQHCPTRNCESNGFRALVCDSQPFLRGAPKCTTTTKNNLSVDASAVDTVVFQKIWNRSLPKWSEHMLHHMFLCRAHEQPFMKAYWAHCCNFDDRIGHYWPLQTSKGDRVRYRSGCSCWASLSHT